MISQPTLDNTLGAAFLGNLASAILYGITNVQTYLFYKNTNKNDGTLLKGIIFFLWVLDGLHLAFVSHSLYTYLVTNFGNPLAVTRITWSVLGTVFTTTVSDFTVRCIFGRRVWILSDKNVLLSIAVYVPAAVTAVSGLAFGAKALSFTTYAQFKNISWVLYLSFGSGVVADAAIAISLCVLLLRSRTGFKRTDSLVNVLMMYTINTGLFTGICSALCLITYAIMPNNFVFIAFYFALSKLFLNALLATLNAREMFCGENIPTSQRGPYLSSFAASSRPRDREAGTAPVTISMQTVTSRGMATNEHQSTSWKPRSLSVY